MKTYYLGDPNEILEAKLAILVDKPSNSYVIDLNDLQSYVEDSSVTKLYVSRDKDNNLVNTEVSNYKNKFRYIIYQNNLNQYIGYTDLEEELEFSKYKIKSLGILFNLTIVNETVVISTSINYDEHNNLTYNHLAHLNLLDYQVPRKSRFDGIQGKQILYSRNLFDLSRSALKNNSKVFRYSNQISRSSKLNESWEYTYFNSINSELDITNEEKIVEIIKSPIDSKLEFCLYNPVDKYIKYLTTDNSVRLYEFGIYLGEGFELYYENGVPMVSSDYFVVTKSNEKYLCYFNNTWKSVKIDKNIRLFKDNINKVIYMYIRQSGILSVLDPYVSNNITELIGNLSSDILYYNLGSVVMIDTDGGFINSYMIYINNHSEYVIDKHNTDFGIQLSDNVLKKSKLIQIGPRSYLMCINSDNSEYLSGHCYIIEFINDQDKPIITDIGTGYLNGSRDFRNIYKIKHNNHIEVDIDKNLPIIETNISGNLFIRYEENSLTKVAIL